jgi:dUTP pyrophosphatase
MNECIIKIKKLKDFGLKTPAYKGDAGYDVFATQNITLKPLERYAMPLGIALEFPNYLVCQVNTKSGNSVKKGFDTIGNIIDSNYRGEIHAIIVNTSNEDLIIVSGDKIAQLVFLKYEVLPIEYVSDLSESDRDENWNGSSNEQI